MARPNDTYRAERRNLAKRERKDMPRRERGNVVEGNVHRYAHHISRLTVSEVMPILDVTYAKY